ncbi:MAG: ATP-dependent DNA helicase RecG [Lachnospiraceae bacterium]|nr:ATP-dependent DNA helicase RecG [Lachnospiraceae bacterium]
MAELTSLKGIGEKTAAAFNRLGIFSAEELIQHYPRDYEVFEEPKPIYKLTPGRIMTVAGVLQQDAVINRFNGMTIVNAYLSDMTGKLQLSWFNAPFMKNNLKAGMHLVFRGRVYEKNGRLVMNQPKLYTFETYREKYEGKMMPLYPLTKGLSNSTVMKAAAEALSLYGRAIEFLPERIIDKYDLSSAETALIRLHFPRNEEELKKARERAVFNEFFIRMLAGAKLSDNARKTASTHRCRPDLRMIKFIAGLPFELTKDQAGAYKEIVSDMNSGHVMNRLVEGDVGSGKTIVAVLAMINAVLNGYQAVIMAPTAVLAKQHFDTINGLLERNTELCDGTLDQINTCLLTGNMSQADKKIALNRIKNKEADIIIGTHALFQENVEYADLGLIVTDEQHRFGVGQREAMFKKGEAPHTLIMSATPIPRTLAIILYSNTDISIIGSRPEGRIPIKNCVVGPGYRKTAYKFIYDEIKKGRQAYIICPAIEKPDEEEIAQSKYMAAMAELENVNDYSSKLKKLFPPEVRISVLHGRMKGDEKERVMESFKKHETDLLISTTVIEVGVDVPNSTVMMIENADRFGLAELHQLRGRVGRGKFQSYCIMINTSDSDKAEERLGILNNSNDGFRIAEEDLKLRGPGDMFGFKQSGDDNYRLADIYTDQEIMQKAKAAVTEITEDDPELDRDEDQRLRRMLLRFMEKGSIM